MTPEERANGAAELAEEYLNLQEEISVIRQRYHEFAGEFRAVGNLLDAGSRDVHMDGNILSYPAGINDVSLTLNLDALREMIAEYKAACAEYERVGEALRETRFARMVEPLAAIKPRGGLPFA